MKSFRTELVIKPAEQKISHADGIVTIGSCFSDSIGSMLHDNKFLVSANPLGVLYSPGAIFKALKHAISGIPADPDGFVEHEGVWNHFDFHSSFSELTKEVAGEKLDQALTNAGKALKGAKVVVITFGTAWTFTRKDLNREVANCHKLPSQRFTKALVSEEQIFSGFADLLSVWKKHAPLPRFILTLSPVRHLKDTIELNAVSKSLLRTAIHKLMTGFSEVSYFPGYEIMLDDLRDYRFYEADMIHPSREALAYIWEKFAETHFGDDTNTLIHAWQSVRAGLQHKAFQPESPKHQQFLREIVTTLEELKSKLSVDKELERVKSQLLGKNS